MRTDGPRVFFSTLCGDYSIGEALLLRKNTKLYNNGDECVLLGARKVGGQLKYRVKLLRGGVYGGGEECGGLGAN